MGGKSVKEVKGDEGIYHPEKGFYPFSEKLHRLFRYGRHAFRQREGFAAHHAIPNSSRWSEYEHIRATEEDMEALIPGDGGNRELRCG